MPKSCDGDRDRCRAAGIPDGKRCEAKWKLAVWQWTRADAEGFRFDWLTFDAGYGGVPSFLKVLDLGRQKYVDEVPASYRVATREGGPRVEARAYLKSTARTGWKRWVQKHESGGVSVWT